MKTQEQLQTLINDIEQTPANQTLISVLGVVQTLISEGRTNEIDEVLRKNFHEFYID